MTLTKSDSPNEENIGSEGEPEKSPGLSSIDLLVDFSKKEQFDAQQSYFELKSSRGKPIPSAGIKYSIWERPPPDFRHCLYEPNPPLRVTREALHPKEYWNKFKLERSKTAPALLIGSQKDTLPKILQQRRPKSRQLRVRFSCPLKVEIDSEFVKSGQHKKSEYTGLKDHDFRQYPPITSLGLPEFATSFSVDLAEERKKKLSYIRGDVDIGESPLRSSYFGRQIINQNGVKPFWDARLILPKDKYPNKSGAFTRHAKYRSAHSAFLERVEKSMLVNHIGLSKTQKDIQRRRAYTTLGLGTKT